MIGCLRTRVRKQPIIALYFEPETVLKFYNIGAQVLSAFECSFSLHSITGNAGSKSQLSGIHIRMCQAPKGIVGKLMMIAHSIISTLVVKV